MWRQGIEDLETARVLLSSGRYYASVFFSHQAAENFLKAAYLEVKKELYPKTHNLVELGRVLGLDDVLEDLMELNPEYSVTRYPDAATVVELASRVDERINPLVASTDEEYEVEAFLQAGGRDVQADQI